MAGNPRPGCSGKEPSSVLRCAIYTRAKPYTIGSNVRMEWSARTWEIIPPPFMRLLAFPLRYELYVGFRAASMAPALACAHASYAAKLECSLPKSNEV